MFTIYSGIFPGRLVHYFVRHNGAGIPPNGR